MNLGLSRNVPSAPMRKRIGLAAGIATALVPLALFTSVAFSERGLSGTIDERVDALTSPTTSAPTEGAGRITEASSTRGKYWREAGKVFADRPAWAPAPARSATRGCGTAPTRASLATRTASSPRRSPTPG